MKATDATERVIKGVGVVLEVTGSELPPAALRAVIADLATYPEHQVLAALKRCMRELKPRQFSLSAVLERLDDGRPGPEEAWSMIPKDEGSSVFWTDEMQAAYGVAAALIASGDNVQARMAFLERYRNLVQLARDARYPVKWTFSPGVDKDGRELAILDAVQKGRLGIDAARALLPYHREDVGLEARLLAAAGGRQMLPEPQPEAKRLPRPAGLIQLSETFRHLKDKSAA